LNPAYFDKPAHFGGPGVGMDNKGAYRYTLWRRNLIAVDLFSPAPTKRGFVQWICLNPSTATETVDDPTLRRVQNFTKAWGYDEMVMTNLFAFRATIPKDMMAERKPEGVENDAVIGEIASRAALIVCAWGNHGSHNGRAARVCAWLNRLGVPFTALAVTDVGEPQHPLYLPANLLPKPYQPQPKEKPVC